MLKTFITPTVATVAVTSTLAAAIVVKVFCCLIVFCIGCSKLILEKYYMVAPSSANDYDTGHDRTLLLALHSIPK